MKDSSRCAKFRSGCDFMFRQLFSEVENLRRQSILSAGPDPADPGYQHVQLLSGLQELAHHGLVFANGITMSQGPAGWREKGAAGERAGGRGHRPGDR